MTPRQPSRKEVFEKVPLITTEALRQDLHKALSIVAPWAHHWSLVAPDGGEGGDPYRDGLYPCIVVALGKKFRNAYTMSAPQFGFLLEVTRFGHGVAVNTNSGHPARYYAKLTFRDAPQDNIPLGRVFADAGLNEAVSALEVLRDLRPENLTKTGAGKPRKRAHHLVKKHVERLVLEREAGGTMPPGFDKDAYFANLDALYEATFAEAKEEAAQ